MVLEKKKFIKSESKELWKLTEELIQESVEKGLYLSLIHILYQFGLAALYSKRGNGARRLWIFVKSFEIIEKAS